jgi:superfamily II DNA/RNA helicase
MLYSILLYTWVFEGIKRVGSHNNWAKLASQDLIEHLRARTMAGLPHIGVLGTKETQEVDAPSDIEEDEYTQPTDSEEDDALYPDWKFIPNKMSYQLSVKPLKGSPIISRVTFFIRIKEGCDGDLKAVSGDRPEQYCLTPEELLSAFKKYELIIKTISISDPPSVQLIVNDIPVQLKNEQVEINIELSTQKIAVSLEDQSDVFLSFQEGKPRLIRQKYKIKFSRSVKLENGYLIVNGELRNESPRSPRSVIPQRKSTDSGEVDDEETALSKVRSDPLFANYLPKMFTLPAIRNNPSGNRYGYLMEVQLEENLTSHQYPYSDHDAAKTVNCIIDDKELNVDQIYHGKVVFKDYSVFEEEVPRMSPGPTPKQLFAELGLDRNLLSVFEEDLKFTNFYLFQAAAIRSIRQAIKDPSSADTIILSARTAGGKTEAFLTPIAQFCIENRDKLGVKALVFYPTKALANDQTNRYIDILYHLNRRISGRKITLGLLHGDILKTEPEPGSEEEWELPLSCPNCDKGVLRPEGNDLKCDACGEIIDFVKIRNRQLIYSDPPDILITNPDTLIWDLMMRPQNHSIFGRPVYVCRNCRRTFIGRGIKKKCDNESCKSQNIEYIQPNIPSFIVFDEVHMFKGTFGINCSLFISRLQSLIKKYSAYYHNDQNPKFIKIGSTATISNPLEFAEAFFDSKPNEISLVPKDEQEKNSFYLTENKDETIRRHHVYIMPYAYNTDSTIGRAIYYVQMRSKHGAPPTYLIQNSDPWDQFLQTITFVNSIRASNNLIALTRRTVSAHLPGIKIDGHTTDFDKKSRAKIERAFNRGDLHCIFATQTLEVGVDFRRIDVVVINGFPFSFNDYLQRIGRGGRRRDSLVITVCQNWKPIDHYYFSNAREALKNPSAHIEPVPITRNNIEASKKHARGAFFDFIATDKDLSNNLDDLRAFKNISSKLPEIEVYCINALGRKGILPQEIKPTLREFVNYIENLALNELQRDSVAKVFTDKINVKYQLTSLRSTDREVMIEVRWTR